MDRRIRKCIALVLTLAGAFAWAPLASAAPKDAAALKLSDDAINNDYLATNFAEAEKKLRRAIGLCGGNGCSAQVRAKLHRDLAVVLVAGLNRAEDGRKEFVEALKADPNTTLEKDLTTPEVEAAYQAAKGGGSGSSSTRTSPTPGPAAGGDITHSPASEQVVLTPVPVYVEMPDGVTPAKVVVRYKPFGATEWKTLELRKMAGGFGAEIPCQDVGSTTGDLSYYVQATDSTGDVVATSGLRNAPHKVPIRTELAGDPPHLPGRRPPQKCGDSADCPPGFPGCQTKKQGGSKGWGATCEQETDCGEGFTCRAGTCESGEKRDDEPAAPLGSGKSCENKNDCDFGETCNSEHVCELASAVKFKKTWVVLSIQQDISILPAQLDVCGNPSSWPPAQFSCYNADGELYDRVPDFGGDGNGNGIQSGPHGANIRILLGADHLLGANVSAGGRLGYVMNTNPKRAMAKFHLEGRLAYWFGKDPFRKKGTRIYLAALAGLADVHDKFDVQVVDDQTKQAEELTVWRRSGGVFAGGALGAMFPLASSHGVLVEMRVQVSLPNSGISISPSLGYTVGF